jgi:hypothetical protein
MHTTRWTVVALVVPTIAALGIACDQRTPTETLRPGDVRATASRSGTDSDGDDNNGLRAVPFVFVGTANQCAPSAAGSQIVTAAWLGGMGLPDNGGPNSNVTTPTNNPNKNDPHLGLLLSKNGPTPDCSSSGARITGVRGMDAGPMFVLGFDYRNGGHCGAGAPRFNVVVRNSATKQETLHFIGGCANAASGPAEQDLAQWSRVRFTAAQQFPPIPPGSRIQSISILYDEGTDTPSGNATSQEPSGVGLAVIDNIFINGKFIRRGKGVAEPHGNRGDRDSDSK